MPLVPQCLWVLRLYERVFSFEPPPTDFVSQILYFKRAARVAMEAGSVDEGSRVTMAGFHFQAKEKLSTALYKEPCNVVLGNSLCGRKCILKLFAYRCESRSAFGY